MGEMTKIEKIANLGGVVIPFVATIVAAKLDGFADPCILASMRLSSGAVSRFNRLLTSPPLRSGRTGGVL